MVVRMDKKDADEVRTHVLKKWAQAGMSITQFDAPVVITNPRDDANIKGGLQAAFGAAMTKYKSRCQLIVCIIDKETKVCGVIMEGAL